MTHALLIGLMVLGPQEPLTHVGSLTESLRSPARVATTPGGTVLVSDTFSNHIARFDVDGTFLGVWPVPAGPIGIAAHPTNGNYYVSLRDEGQVAIYDSAFTFTGYLGDGDPPVTFVRPTDIEIAEDTGNIYVVDAEGDCVYGFAPDGGLILSLGIRGGLPGEFRYPSAITVDEARNRLLVADHDNFRVQAFTTGGVFELRFGYRLGYVRDEGARGWMPRTQGLTVDAEGRIYVADALMSTVRVFDPTGLELARVLEYGFGPGDLRTPAGLVLNADGSRLYVVSTNTSSVEVYEVGSWDGFPPLGPGPDAQTRPGQGAPPGTFDGPHMINDAPIICGRCHGFSDLPGGHGGLIEGQTVQCMSCHTAAGQALDLPAHELDLADPYGTNPDAADGRGISHAWGVPAISVDADSVGPAPDSEMQLYLDNGHIKCATCHDQHCDYYGPYPRIPNDGDALCKECHAPRNEGLGERGTHPVGFDYPGGEGEFPDDSDVSPLYIKAGMVECLTCHAPHYADSGGANDGAGDGLLLRAASDEGLCQICHTEHVVHAVGGDWQPTCRDCHDVHDPDNENLSLVATSVYNQTLGLDMPVVLTARTGPNGFGCAGPVDDGICQVCHTETTYHTYDCSGEGHYNGADCIVCHAHADGFIADEGAPAACGACHAPVGDARLNEQVGFVSGTDINGDDGIAASEAAGVCDGCHSPDGAFDGVVDDAAGQAAQQPGLIGGPAERVWPSADGTVLSGGVFGAFDDVPDHWDWSFDESSYEGAITLVTETPESSFERRVVWEYDLRGLSHQPPVAATLSFTLRGAPVYGMPDADVHVYSFPADLTESPGDYRAGPAVFAGSVTVAPYQEPRTYTLDISHAVNEALRSGSNQIAVRFQINPDTPHARNQAFIDALDDEPSTKPYIIVEKDRGSDAQVLGADIGTALCPLAALVMIGVPLVGLRAAGARRRSASRG